MSYVEIDFTKDRTDLLCVNRYIAEKLCYQSGANRNDLFFTGGGY